MNNCFVNLYKGMVEERAKKMAQKYDGQFCILTNGEKLKNVKSGAEIAFYSPAQKSYECNGGAYIFNLGNGISILTCSDEFAQYPKDTLRLSGECPLWILNCQNHVIFLLQ